MPASRHKRPRAPQPPPSPPPSDPSLPEDIATLQAQLRLCRAQNTYLHRELATALRHAPFAPTDGTEAEQVQLALDQLRQRYAVLTLHYEQAQQDIAQLTYVLAFAHKALGWKEAEPSWALDRTGTEVLDHCLRHLLTLAHPDKWSQGQPATELAHALASAINAQRERLG